MFRDGLNTALDGLVRPEVHIFRQPFSSFTVCLYAGLALATTWSLTLAEWSGLSPLVMAGLAAVATAIFFGFTLAWKVLTGVEHIVVYRQGIAAGVGVAGALRLFHLPMLPYMDITIVGLGLGLACCRIGCFMVGCCHGKPSAIGSRYREAHIAAGFTPSYVGVRLFPIQAIESLWAFGMVAIGSILVLSDRPAGTTLAWSIVTYALARFFFEFARGNPGRRHLLGFSEAQWIALLLTTCVVWAEVSGALPTRRWQLAIPVLLAMSMILVTWQRNLQPSLRARLLLPNHVKEVAAVLESSQDPAGRSGATIHPPPAGIRVCRTSLGIRISTGTIPSAAGGAQHYAISAESGGMTRELAGVIASLILRLSGHTGSSELLMGSRGIFHLVIRPRSDADDTSQRRLDR
jgi:prolipoprotein diacylglyceryltransferase